MKITNESQKQALFKTIWSIANKLRNQVDSWDFKSYVLGFLFYRYLSEDFINFAKQLEKDPDFNYCDFNDDSITDSMKDYLIKVKGYYIAPSQLFQNVIKTSSDDKSLEDFNEKLSSIFKAIENSSMQSGESCLKGLFDDISLNSKKLGKETLERNKRLLEVMQTIGEIDLGDFSANQIDLLGDAYEYLIRMYASVAGQSGGEFYTPQEVSELLFRLALGKKTQIESIYDPTCGSGSLLLKAAKLISKDRIGKIYGQEINPTSYNLARMNMFLHGIPYKDFHLECDNTLINPQHLDHKFEIIVSNPPYSIEWIGNDNPKLLNDDRFRPANVLAPKTNADFAFIMHIVHQLQAKGQAAVVCFTGIMHRKGAEQKIRQYLIESNLVSAIIQLPANIFYGTSISTVIMVLSKAKVDDKVVFIDAANEYQKIEKKNQLQPEHIDKIVNHYLNHQDVDHFVKVVDKAEIVDNNYDLSVNRYVKKLIIEEIIDIDELEDKMEKIVENVDRLRNDIKIITKSIRNGTFLKN